jgi:hypothetical protein
MKIKIFNITIWVIYLIVFDEFLHQNKFIIEKHIKFIIEIDTKKIYWIKKIQGCTNEKSYKKSIFKKI